VTDPSDETPDAPHADDGLDLAKSLTRATAGATPKQRKRQRNRDQQSRGRVSGAHPDDRDPQPLAGEVSRLVEDRGWELDLRMRGVFARWPELVAGAEQVLVTAAVAADVPDALAGVTYTVADGEVTRERPE